MGDTISDLTTNEFDASLLELFECGDNMIPLRPPGFGITRQELSNQKGLSFNQAKRSLDTMVTKGQLEKMLMRAREGVKSNPMVYFRPGEWPPGE